jgi:hypothetical protein
MTIKRFDVLSVAKIAGVVYGGLGVLIGVVFACFALVGAGFASVMQQESQMPPFFSLMFGVGAIIVLPIMYGVMGFIFGALSTWLFNVAAGITGGVKIQLES